MFPCTFVCECAHSLCHCVCACHVCACVYAYVSRVSGGAVELCCFLIRAFVSLQIPHARIRIHAYSHTTCTQIKITHTHTHTHTRMCVHTQDETSRSAVKATSIPSWRHRSLQVCYFSGCHCRCSCGCGCCGVGCAVVAVAVAAMAVALALAVAVALL
jgi:hypothetical protein